MNYLEKKIFLSNL